MSRHPNDPDSDSVWFPDAHILVVTTVHGVFAWQAGKVSNIFRSGSGGIVAAKQLPDGSGTLAVADSEVVILHDTTRKTARSYRLKRKGDHVRLLQYANESRSLFFTTSLENAVQAYSVQRSRLLEPSHTHPSPPACLAVSPTSHLLVSASSKPSTIYVQNLTLRTRPIRLVPNVTSSAAVAASFHPRRSDIFVLAFADSSLALYDATRLFRDNDPAGRKPRVTDRGSGAEVAYLHASGKSKDAGVSEHMSKHLPPLESTSMSERDAGGVGAIVGANFIPDRRAEVVMVNTVGRCTIVDFENPDRKRGRISRSWHIRAPATSLSILAAEQAEQGPQTHASDKGTAIQRTRSDRTIRKDSSRPSRGVLIAIGRIDGRVFVYDTAGDLCAQRSFDSDGGRIVDLDWLPAAGIITTPESTPGPDDHAAALEQSSTLKASGPTSQTGRSKARAPRKNSGIQRAGRKSVGSVLAAGRKARGEEVVLLGGQVPASVDGTTPRETVEQDQGSVQANDASRIRSQDSMWEDVVGPPQAKYMHLFSPVKAHDHPNDRSSIADAASRRPVAPLDHRTVLYESRGAISAPQLWPQRVVPLNDRSKDTTGTPKLRHDSPREAIPSSEQPTPLAKGGLAIQRDAKVLTARKHRARLDPRRTGRGLALFAPYMQKNIVYSAKVRGTSDPQDTTKENVSTGIGKAESDDIWLENVENVALTGPVAVPASSAAAEAVTMHETMPTVSHQQTSDRTLVSNVDDGGNAAAIGGHGQTDAYKAPALPSDPLQKISSGNTNGLRIQSKFSSSSEAEPPGIGPELTEYVPRAQFEEELERMRRSLQADLRSFQLEMREQFEAQRRFLEESFERHQQER
ncbi:MAG: hypothetical protein M1817_000052 [Caeruleum heppii]|nr:MAG: hypothetical protein M1817_000052 [Caeruleum heppii]